MSADFPCCTPGEVESSSPKHASDMLLVCFLELRMDYILDDRRQQVNPRPFIFVAHRFASAGVSANRAALVGRTTPAALK